MVTFNLVSLTSTVFDNVRLHTFCTVSNGGTPKADSRYWDGDVPFITPPDLRDLDGKEVLNPTRFVTTEGALAGSTISHGGVVVSCRAPVGYVGQLKSEFAFNQGCKVLKSNANQNYVAYALVASREAMIANANGTTFSEISQVSLGNMSIPLPPLDTQRRIAEYLDAETAQIDGMMAKLDELVELLGERRNSRFRLLTEGIEKVRLSVIADFQTGGTPKVKPEHSESLDVPWVKPGSVDDGCTNADNISSGQANQLSIIPANSTLVVGIGATVGKVGYSPHQVTTNQQITSLVPRNCVDHRYLYFAMKDRSSELRATAGGTTLPIINNTQLGTYSIPLPPLDEQRRIAERLDTATTRIDTMIDKCNELRDLLKERRAALITAVVTGQKEVPHV